MRKTYIWIALLVIGSLCIFGCAKKDSDAVRIGVIAELTGDIPAVGAPAKNAELAVREQRRRRHSSGDKKYPVELIIEDNAGKADQSASSAQKLITQQKVTAIVGP